MTPYAATRRLARIAPAALAAVLLLAACGGDDDDQASQPTPAPTTDDQPVATPSTSEPPPATAPPTSPPPAFPDDQLYEAIATVIDDADGPRACFEVMESLPPQCGTGIDLVDWSWDAITVEITQGDTTWVDQIYVNGTYDPAAQAFTVAATRLPTDEDRQRLLLSGALPDFSVPCPAPDGGWPARSQEWPGEEIAAIDGYAGAWSSEGPGVMTVKFTGDLAAAEAAVRAVYSDPVCVVGAELSEAELSAIQEQLLSLSSVQLLSTAIYVDVSGEWIEAFTIAPDPARQAAFDEEFGEDVVRLDSRLQPVSDTTS